MICWKLVMCYINNWIIVQHVIQYKKHETNCLEDNKNNDIYAILFFKIIFAVFIK